MAKKHVSPIANDLLHRCAQRVGNSIDALVEEFDARWKPEMGGYSRKLVEFCSSKALNEMCSNIGEKISDGSFNRFTFDMMIAWEKPSLEEVEDLYTERVAKEKEDIKVPRKLAQEQDDTSLFYSDLMPLLVDQGPNVGEESFVWLATLVPLVADVANARFTFETLTAPTAYRLHFPSYDKFLKETHSCINHLQKQAKPKGVELADDEFILHVEGTASTQRVVRHIGGTSWPGRLTLTNYTLYFEASGALSYEDAIKLELSKDIEQTVKPAATGPFGAPIFDKAIIYESSDLQEGVVLEFPEMTSSTRRDHWLALVTEIILLHRFLSKFKVESLVQEWEMHARTILGIIRLHAAREMLRISPPPPKNFLIFSLFDELPKGDYVLEELAESFKNVNSGHPCSASSILRSLNVSQLSVPTQFVEDAKEVSERNESVSGRVENLSSLESAIDQVREEAKEVGAAKATAEGLKVEGIGDSALVLMELLKPIRSIVPWLQEVIRWQRPATTFILIAATLLIVYKEWVGKAIAALLVWIVSKMASERLNRRNRAKIVIVTKPNGQSTVESIVSVQRGLQVARDMVQLGNISILKFWSIFESRAPKHADMVMTGMTGIAVVLAIVPFKFIIMGTILYCFIMTSNLGKRMQNERGNRRLKEWWDSIPVVPVQIVDDVPDKEPPLLHE
ncbi:hypothetical protein LguiA_024421 [Lonicera macranthoides]